MTSLTTERDWQLAAQAIAVKIRWLGLVMGYFLANSTVSGNALALNLILSTGLLYTTLDTFYFLRRVVFLQNYPLLVSCLEAIFIGLLCYFESGLESGFRFYYLLSLICSAIRYSPRVTSITCGLDIFFYSLIYIVEPTVSRKPDLFFLTLVLLVWASWAASAMAKILKQAHDDLHRFNETLRENQSLLESRIQERTQQLEESQAQVLHQEKMAAFGLLAAGIAHEVGNPLTSISNLVQMLEFRNTEPYTQEKLALVTGQLARIQLILRELITFSRPASDQSGKVNITEVVEEALGIAKYYKGGKSRNITSNIDRDLPLLHGVRDQLVQVVFNLVLNAIDATGKGGTIAVSVCRQGEQILLKVKDDGHGIDPSHRERLFRPYFTTKKHGTGLGLFVIRRILEAHQGSIDVESNPGSGTCFTVTLPINLRDQLPLPV
jgi:two-component system, NtrC family, sensor kinase